MLGELFAAEAPVSAEHISARLKLDAASVYRNLELLEREGLVRHVQMAQSQTTQSTHNMHKKKPRTSI